MAGPYHHVSTSLRMMISTELDWAAQALEGLEVIVGLFVFDFHTVAAARAFSRVLTDEEMVGTVESALEALRRLHWLVESASGAVRLCHLSLSLSLVEPVASEEARQFRSMQGQISVFA